MRFDGRKHFAVPSHRMRGLFFPYRFCRVVNNFFLVWERKKRVGIKRRVESQGKTMMGIESLDRGPDYRWKDYILGSDGNRDFENLWN